uniref:Secreted protein n=1 Tax=Trichogramma kaykai TaxID=54128 RepID=A0ABD2X8E9_9HYME
MWFFCFVLRRFICNCNGEKCDERINLQFALVVTIFNCVPQLREASVHNDATRPMDAFSRKQKIDSIVLWRLTVSKASDEHQMQ